MHVVTEQPFPDQVMDLRGWVKKDISCLNLAQVHLKKFLTLRIRIVIVPYENWNLRLVNIQRQLKAQVWNISAEQFYRKGCGDQGTPTPSTFYLPLGLHLNEVSTPFCNILAFLVKTKPAIAPSESAGGHTGAC